MRTRHAIGLVALLAAGLSLAGCGALLGGGKPAQLYRFGVPSTVADVPGVLPAPRATLLLMPIRFAAEVEGDRVLASRERETLYIKGMRWVAPAPTLFTEALRADFRSRAPWIAMTDRGTSSTAANAADDVLQIRIERFEARYDDGEASPPTIHIGGEATLGDARTHALIGSYRLVAEQRAERRDAAAIMAAFDQATSAVTAATVDWASATVLRR